MIGFIYMTIATCSLSVVYTSMNILQRKSRIPPYEITYLQGIVCSLSMFALLKYMESRERRHNRAYDIFTIPKGARAPLLLRGFFGFASNLATAIAMKLLPLSKATILFYTNPIFIGIFGWLFLNEKITNYDIAGVAATFLGVVIFTNDPFSSAQQAVSDVEWMNDFIGTTSAIIGAIITAGAMLSIRKVGTQCYPMNLPFSWGLFNVLFSPMMFFVMPLISSQDRSSTEYGWYELKYIALITIFVSLFQIFISLAFITEKAARVAPIGAL